MAREKNNKTKNRKPFLTLGLILLGFVLASILTIAFVGLELISPAIFIRNVALLMATGGAGIGIGALGVKGINRAINGKSMNKSNKRDRNLERKQDKELQQEEEMEQEEEYEEDQDLNFDKKRNHVSEQEASYDNEYEEDEEYYEEKEEKHEEVKKPVSRGR